VARLIPHALSLSRIALAYPFLLAMRGESTTAALLAALLFIVGVARDDDALQGPTVAPGDYRVQLTYDDVVQEQPLQVRWDPINEYSADRIAEQQAITARVFGMVDDIFRRIVSLQKIREQVALRRSLASDAGDEATVAAADTLLESLEAWQKSVSTPDRTNGQDVLNFAPKIDAFLIDLYQATDDAVLGITKGQRDRLDDLEPAWNAAMQAWDALVDDEVAAFSRMAGPSVIVPEWD